MLFIISILLGLLFVMCADKAIRKHASVFYIIAVFMSAGFLVYSQMGLGDYIPKWAGKYCVGIFSRSAFSAALFTLVMYTAVLNKKLSITKKLYAVRGEISIIACILTLGHNISYGKSIFKAFFMAPTSFTWYKFIATIASLTLIVIMIPLMITSFKCVRKRMKFKTWKNIQRSAYLFYGLIYLHVMCLYIPKMHKGSMTDILVYSIVFIGYGILRVYKFTCDINKKRERMNSSAQAA